MASRTSALLAAAAVAALALSGCDAASDKSLVGGGKVIGQTVTVYSLLPNAGSGPSAAMVEGEKLALADAHGMAGALAVNFASLDAGGGDRTTAADAARSAISDGQIVAVIADATPAIVPLFNAAGILQVAPGGDLALTSDPNELPSGLDSAAPLGAAGSVPAGFDARFRASFGSAPTPPARTGYRAMQQVLRAIGAAGSRGGDRTRVIESYMAGRAG